MYELDEDYHLALVEDKQGLQELIELMHQESPYRDYPLRKKLAEIVTGVTIGLFYKETLVGFLNCIGIDHPLIDVKIAFEQGYFVHPDHRGKHSLKLIEAYEDWATMNKMQVIQLMHMNTPQLDKIYEKLGYKLYEKAYLKNVS